MKSLREQLKSYDLEEEAFSNTPSFDKQKVQRIRDLESLVEMYKERVFALEAELKETGGVHTTELESPFGESRQIDSVNKLGEGIL